MAKVTLKLDTTPALALIEKLSALAEASLETRERLLDFIESGAELVSIDPDLLAASGAGEMVVRLEPSEALRGLLSALGAGNVV
jgi:hypothetical protein